MAASGNGVREDHPPWPVQVETPSVMHWSEEDFEALIETGAADRLGGRLELRGGVIWRMNAIYPPHARMRGAIDAKLDDTSWLVPTLHIFVRNALPGAVPPGATAFETDPPDFAPFAAAFAKVWSAA